MRFRSFARWLHALWALVTMPIVLAWMIFEERRR
jgi:hypothetical protein